MQVMKKRKKGFLGGVQNFFRGLSFAVLKNTPSFIYFNLIYLQTSGIDTTTIRTLWGVTKSASISGSPPCSPYVLAVC